MNNQRNDLERIRNKNSSLIEENYDFELNIYAREFSENDFYSVIVNLNKKNRHSEEFQGQIVFNDLSFYYYNKVTSSKHQKLQRDNLERIKSEVDLFGRSTISHKFNVTIDKSVTNSLYILEINENNQTAEFKSVFNIYAVVEGKIIFNDNRESQLF